MLILQNSILCTPSSCGSISKLTKNTRIVKKHIPVGGIVLFLIYKKPRRRLSLPSIFPYLNEIYRVVPARRKTRQNNYATPCGGDNSTYLPLLA